MQENPHKGGWITDNSRDLGQKTLSRFNHCLMHCVMCMHDESTLLAYKTNVRDPWLHLVSHHKVGDRGAAISHIKRQADDV